MLAFLVLYVHTSTVLKNDDNDDDDDDYYYYKRVWLKCHKVLGLQEHFTIE